MIRALVWKEYREQRAIWLTLAVVGGSGLYGLSRLMAPEGILSSNGFRESLQTVAVLFAWTYGLVCGAMLLANENEAGTMSFLDMLPARRLELWIVKCLFGLLLLLAQVAVLAGFVVGLGITETNLQLLATLLGMLCFGLVALSWSLLFSALGENVLNVIGFSFIGQIAGAFVTSILLVPVAIVLTVIRGGQPGNGVISRLILACIGVLVLTVGPVAGSARLFTRLDRQRARSAKWGSRLPVPMSVGASWARLLWLSYVQMRRLLLGLTIFSLALGFLLPLLGPAAWPALALLLGVLCGVTIWSDEQLSASFRFLGDQRFPLGRVWAVKVGMRFALAVFAAFLLLLPSLLLALIHQVEAAESSAERIPFTTIPRVPFFADLFHSGLVGSIMPVGLHLGMWLLYGFTAGHLSGLLFRKSLVAAVVALGSAGMLVCLWIPSLVGIGLHFWQVAGVPFALLVAGRLLMPAWTAERLLARGTFVRLGVILLGAGLWIAGGLWYRVVEIPNLPDAFDMRAFVASIPSLDKGKNDAGMAIHSAWHDVEQMTHELVGQPAFPPRQDAHTFPLEMDAILSAGWPSRPSKLDQFFQMQKERYERGLELGKKLDELFRNEWYGHVSKVADFPVGVVEDAKLLNLDIHTGQWHHLEFLNQLLAVRGLQMQAGGNHRDFVDLLRIGLALARNVQNHAAPLNVHTGRQAELISINSLDRWLAKLPGHPELLERVRDILLDHEAQLPGKNDVLKTAYLIAQNTLDGVPEKLVEREVVSPKDHPFGNLELQRAEMDLVSLLWRIPWEHERHQRILRWVFEGEDTPRHRRQAEKWGGFAMSNLDLLARREDPREHRIAATLHAAQLKAALRLYQAKNGKLPATLDELVQHKYLPNVPNDPFDGLPFRYRLTQDQGGRLVAILWSVGEDRCDDGGKQQGIKNQRTSPGEDLVYPVPPPPR